MNILIIGSKGFIGSHAMKYFGKQHAVWGVDVVTDYTSDNYFLIDATNADFTGIFATHAFDVCINCSGASSVPLSFQNPLRDFELNVNNVFKLLNALKMYQPACKFMNLSSAAVYGNPVYMPIDELHPTLPISPYGKHKLMAEQVCNEFHSLFGLSTVSLRIFSAYGNGLQKQFFWDLYKKVLLDKEIVLWGNGSESRDFIFIDDLVRAFDIIMQHASFAGQAINIANGQEISIAEAAKTFLNSWQAQIPLHFNGQTRDGDPQNWCADIHSLQAMGYAPLFSLQKGLQQYTSWLKSVSE